MTDKAVIEGLKKYGQGQLLDAPLFVYFQEAINRIYDLIRIKKVLENKIAPSNEKVREIELILNTTWGSQNEL